MIIGSVCLSVVAAYYYLQLAQPIFEAEARLLVRQKGGQFETDKSFLKDRQFLATESEVLRSEAILRRSLEQVELRLPDNYEEDEIVLALDSMTVTPSPVADVITINYRSHWEDDAIAVVRAAIESYQQMLHEAESQMHENTVDVLAEREKQLGEELAVLQQKYEDIRSSSPLVGEGRESLKLHAQRLTDLSERLTIAKSRKFEMEKKLESFAGFKANYPNDSPSTKLVLLRDMETDFGTSDDPDGKTNGIPVKRAQAMTSQDSEFENMIALAYTGFGDAALTNSAAGQMFRQQAESKLARLHDVERRYWIAKAGDIKASLKQPHPQQTKVIEELEHWETLLEEQRADWNKFLDEQVVALSSVLDQELQTAVKTEHELEMLYQSTEDQVKALDIYLVREQHAKANIERLEAVHETILARMLEFELADQGVSQGRVSVDVRVLEGPELTSKKVWPLPPLVLAGSLLFGCLVPVALLTMFGRRQQPSDAAA